MNSHRIIIDNTQSRIFVVTRILIWHTRPGPERHTRPGPERHTRPDPERHTRPGPERLTRPDPTK